MKPFRLACVALVAAAALAGCADDPAPESPPPTPSASPSARPTAVPMGSEGLNLRYLDEDGEIKTLEVKDFPR